MEKKDIEDKSKEKLSYKSSKDKKNLSEALKKNILRRKQTEKNNHTDDE